MMEPQGSRLSRQADRLSDARGPSSVVGSIGPDATRPPSAVSQATSTPHWRLLLTTSTSPFVDLRNTSYGVKQQRSPLARQRIYEAVLSHWLRNYPQLPITVVESGWQQNGLGRGSRLLWVSRATAKTSPTASARVRALRLDPAASCSRQEIGCHEADAIYRAVGAMRRSHEQSLKPSTRVLKVTGRYAITSNVDEVLRGCPLDWDVALQNSSWHDSIHGTQVLGFRAELSDSLFGWSRRGGECQECHVHRWVAMHPQVVVCHLPRLSVRRVREGSTGSLRTYI